MQLQLKFFIKPFAFCINFKTNHFGSISKQIILDQFQNRSVWIGSISKVFQKSFNMNLAGSGLNLFQACLQKNHNFPSKQCFYSRSYWRFDFTEILQNIHSVHVWKSVVKRDYDFCAKINIFQSNQRFYYYWSVTTKELISRKSFERYRVF